LWVLKCRQQRRISTFHCIWLPERKTALTFNRLATRFEIGKIENVGATGDKEPGHLLCR